MENSTIPSICRACLSEIGEFKSVFVSDDNSGYTIHLSEMIMAFASVQITFGDGLPEQICVTCAEQTTNMYLFKLKCEESDKTLRERLELSPVQEIDNIREEKYSEYLEMNDYKETDLYGLIKSEINIDEPREGDLSDDKNQATFGFNETEIIGSEKSVLDGNELCKKQFKCEFCYKTLCNQSGLNRHLRDVHKTHPATKEFECETCNKRFSRKYLLLRHKIAHAKKMEFGNFSVNDDFEDNAIIIKTETEFYPCPECSVPSEKKEEMEMHLKQHNKVSANISCHVCTKKFSNQANLNQHLRIHCKPHICSTCNKGFYKPEQLTNHMKVHSGVKRYICDICLKGFNHNTSFKNHMRIHSGEKPFLCSACHKGFNRLSTLQQHMILHSSSKVHRCSTCSKRFATSGKLAAHKRVHSGEKLYECDVCKIKFRQSDTLECHKRIHTGEKPYECDVCNMKFRQSDALECHKRMHTGEKPYECDVCNMKFSRSSALKRHKRTHTGEKPYVCKICAKAYSQPHGLTAHLKKHTGEMPKTEPCDEIFRHEAKPHNAVPL